jgi:hypothetical protein
MWLLKPLGTALQVPTNTEPFTLTNGYKEDNGKENWTTCGRIRLGRF